MIKRSRKFLIILLSAIMCLSFIAMPFVAYFTIGFVPVKSAEELPTIGFSNPVYYADQNNMVTLEVSLSGQLAEKKDKVTVTYHTESATAIAGIDFNKTSGTLEFNKDERIQKIRVPVTSKNRFLVKYGDIDYSRYFTVVLDTADNGEIDQNKKVAEAHLIGGTQLSLVKESDFSYLSEYANIQHTYQGSKGFADEHLFQSWKETGMTLNNTTTKNWVSDYINTGLANAYGIPLVGEVSTDTIRHKADFMAAVGNGQFALDDNGKLSGLNDSNAQSKVPGILMKLDVDFHFFADTSNDGKGWTEGAGIYFYDTGGNPYDKDEDYWDIYSGNSWMNRSEGEKFYSYSGFGSGSSGSFRQGYYFLIKPYQNSLDMRMTLYNYSSVYDKIAYDLEFDMALKDFTAPRLLDSYIDDSALATTGKLRLIMRYSEPVYESENRTVGVKFGNSVTVHYFKYAGGNYSDTHFYELETLGTPIGNITDNYSLVDNGAIKDLALKYSSNKTRKNNSIDETSIKSAGRHIISSDNKNINYRNPVMGVDLEKSSTFNSSYQLGLSMGSYSSTDLGSTTGVGNGTIYYTWNTNQTGLGNNKDRYAFSGKCVEYAPLNISLAGSEEIRLNGSKQNIGGEWIMKYDASTFVVDDITYVMNKYDPNKGNSFHIQGQTNEYTFSGIGKKSFFIDNKTFIFDGSVLTVERAGTYYLHVYGISEYNLSRSATFGPYKIDGSCPVITAEVPNDDKLRIKEFELEFYDRPIVENNGATAANISGVDTVSINIKTLSGETYSEYLFADGGNRTDKYKSIVTPLGNKWKYYSSVMTDDEELGKIDPLIYSLMADSTRENLTISFTVTDKCGNSYTTEPAEYVYDLREGFNSSMEIYNENSLKLSPLFTANKIAVYDAQGMELKVSLVTDDPGLGQIIDCSLEDENGNFTSIYHNDNAPNGVIPELSFTITKSGYYQFTPQIEGKTGDGAYIKVGARYRFYVTNGLSDNTANYQTSNQKLVLSNSVYQVSGVQFTYLNAGKKVARYNYGATYDESLSRYTGGSTTPTFSNPNIAKKYFEYMEYQDLYLICLSDNNASALNNGSSPEYRKADGEPVAKAGELWVRYKRNTWSLDSNETSWVYYFYKQSGSEKNGIDINVLNENERFKSAINSVVSTIMSKGKVVYLISGDNVTYEGAPKIAPSAIHYGIEETSVTVCETKLSSKVTFMGDPNIYKNSITTIDGKVLPLATNLPITIGNHTQLYFRSSGADVPSNWGEITSPDSGWVRLNVENGDILRNAMFDYSTDIYTILELDENGVNRFEIYMDKTLPIVKIITAEGAEPIVLDGSIDRFYGKSIEFVGTEVGEGAGKKILGITGEYDDQAYVGVFSFAGTLNNVYYADSLSGLVLSDNNYKIQIGDRSGNIFIVSLYLSSTPLEVSIGEYDYTDGVTVTIKGRDRDEILRYEVSCNNKLVATEVPQTATTQYIRQTFRDPGIYTVYIEDIYGNKETKEYNYKRSVPNVIWSYFSGSSYEEYNEKDEIVCMTKIQDEKYSGVFNIYTSTLLRFRLDVLSSSSQAKWDIIGLEDGEYTENAVNKAVTMTVLKPFELKVYYADYPDNYVTYNIIVDSQSPYITASYIGAGYAYEEIDPKDYINLIKIGDRVTPESLIYGLTAAEVRDVENGEIIQGNFITVSVSDNAGIRYVTVEVDGKAPYEVALEDGMFKIDGYGEYVIRAVDMLGNTSVFRFTNVTEPFTEGMLDGQEVESGISYKYYGHDVLELSEVNQGSTEIIIKYNDQRFYGFYRYENGALRNGYYEIIGTGEYLTDDDGNPILDSETGEPVEGISYVIEISDEAILDIKAQSFKYEEPYLLGENEYFRLEVIVDKNGNLTYKVTCLSGTINVESLYTVGESKIPDYFNVEMSKECSDIPVYSGNEEVLTNKDGKIVCVGEALWFDGITDSKVISVKVARSDNQMFSEYTTIYKYGSLEAIDYIAEEDGIYSVKIINIYGNETEYLFALSKSFLISATVTYTDGEQEVYLYEEGLTIYLNNKVSITAYAPNVVFTVNGVEVEGTGDDSSRTIILSRGNNGTTNYEVVARDEGGVERRFSFVIGTDSLFTYNDSWLTGYNEDALLKAEDYTNKKLSVVWNTSLYQVKVVKDGEITVVYDLLSQQQVTEFSRFTDCIGNDGDGEYTVIFRNRFGDVIKKVVHYSETPTLVLTRSTYAGGYVEDYDIDYAVKEGFYSSNALVFNSTANLFKFTVTTGEGSVITPTSYPYILEFDSESGNGAFEYKIDYVDAYGFKYSFNACLLRQDIAIGTEQMDLVLIEKKYYTRDNVAITFASSLNGTVSHNGKDPVPYKSGSVLRADGTFYFEITDIAGNLKSFVVIHDSIIDYTLSSSITGTPILKGGVSNADSVLFKINENDTGFIKYVIYNGEEQTDYSNNTFKLCGHWELIIEDRIGNSSYFDFYLINHCVSDFEYTAPSGYTVSEVWLTETDGSSRPTLYSGDSIHLKNEGVYAVVMVSKLDNIAVNFTVTVDKSLPNVKLVGCNDGEETAREITLEGLQYGDTIEITKNGIVSSKFMYTSSYDAPKFTDGGEYVIKVTNLAGMSQTYSFTKKHIANTATSVIIIISCIAVMLGVFIGLLYRNCSKTDK